MVKHRIVKNLLCKNLMRRHNAWLIHYVSYLQLYIVDRPPWFDWYLNVKISVRVSWEDINHFGYSSFYICTNNWNNNDCALYTNTTKKTPTNLARAQWSSTRAFRRYVCKVPLGFYSLMCTHISTTDESWMNWDVHCAAQFVRFVPTTKRQIFYIVTVIAHCKIRLF